MNYNCNINNDMQYTLKPGTTYQFVLYAIVNGTEYKDVMRSFGTTTATIKKLKSGKCYYFRIRAYKRTAYGGKKYGRWSNVRKVRVR